MKTQFEIKTVIAAKPSEIYGAWLNSEKHAAMTGGDAQCSDKEGGEFTAWDGYISGSNTRLTSNKEIIQKWRTSEFKDTDEDSDLIIQLAEHTDGTELTLIHKNIPEGESDYEKGWEEHYFEPMIAYFK